MGNKELGSFPLVSLIIPVFNAAIFIENGYKQINNQSYKNLEIIFVDNNSTDKTLQLLETISSKDSRVRISFEKKQGAGAARNHGLKIATADIVSFFDIDDLMSEEKIKNHVEILLKFQEVQMVFGVVKKVYENGNFILLSPGGFLESKMHYPPWLGFKWLQYMGDIVMAVTCRKISVINVGGFEENLLRGEDAAFLIKFTMKYIVYFQNSITDVYVRHGNSTTSKMNSDSMTFDPYLKQYLEFYLPYFENLQYFDEKNSALNLVYEQINSSLYSGLHLNVKGFKNRIKLYATELKSIKKRGYPNLWILFTLLLIALPFPVAKFINKVYSKLFGVKISSLQKKI